MAYATIAELDAWLGRPAPLDQAPRLLERASTVVAYHVRTPVATDTTTGMPTDPDQRLSISQATCAQVEAWLASSEQGDIVDCGDNDKPAPPIARRALRILHQHGLTNAAVSTS